MTSRDSLWSRVRQGTVIAVAAAASAVIVLATTGVASGAATQGQPGFGAAARIAVGQAAARLAPRSGMSIPATGR
jgi:hypothetical protein